MKNGVLVRSLCATAAVVLFPTGAHTQAPQKYAVKPGDTMLSIAEAVTPPGATVNQAGLATVRANQAVFFARAGLVRGASIAVPDLKTMQSTDAADAEHEFGRLWRGEQHYRAGRSLERSKDMFYAFVSYVEAAKFGHGVAQYRLGQLYDNDFSGFVKHDLLESARWYDKARVSQVDVPRPDQRGFTLPR